MNRLIVLSGVPGSGKSHFTKELKKALNKHVYIISSDELRYKILGNQRDLSEDALIWQIYYFDSENIFHCQLQLIFLWLFLPTHLDYCMF